MFSSISYSTVASVVLGVSIVLISFFLGYKAGQMKTKLAPPDVATSSVTGTKTLFERNFTLKSKGNKSKKTTNGLVNVVSVDDVNSGDEQRQSTIVERPSTSPAGSPRHRKGLLIDSEGEMENESSSTALATPPSPQHKQHKNNVNNRQPIKILTLEEAAQDVKHYTQTIDKASNVLHSIIGTNKALYSEYDLKRSWQMIFSNGSSQFFTSKEKEDGILIKGNSYSSQNVSPKDIVKWMVDEDVITGLEGIAYRSEVIQKIMINEATHECIIVRRLCCKAGTLMSSKRDFILVTSISVMEYDHDHENDHDHSTGSSGSSELGDNGGSNLSAANLGLHNSNNNTHNSSSGANNNNSNNNADPELSYIISTRSVPEDFISPQRGAKNGGYIRGLVFGSGYILKSIPASSSQFSALYMNSNGSNISNISGISGVTNTSASTAASQLHNTSNGASLGTEISFAVHMDMLGSRSGRTNVSKTTTIVTAVVQTMARVQAEVTSATVSAATAAAAAASKKSNIKASQSAPALGQPVMGRGQSASVSSGEAVENRPHNAPPALQNPTVVDINCPRTRAHSEILQANSRIQLTGDEKDELVCVAKNALFKLRNLHALLPPTDSDGAGKATIAARPHSPTPLVQPQKWDVFYEQDDVILRELAQDGVTTPAFGVLSATCSIEAPPHIVRTLLVDHPDAIDGLLEGRSVLNYLTATTYVQWLAYGAIYPLGAKDFLLVTSEEAYEKRTTSSGNNNTNTSNTNTSTEQGFVIASTSIDDICEMDQDDVSDAEPQCSPQHRTETRNGQKQSKPATTTATYTAHGSGYNRSCLKLAGYVGVANSSGGTDLTLIIDLDIYSDSPAWLLQFLSQYGLTETMNRIRKASLETHAYYKQNNYNRFTLSIPPVITGASSSNNIAQTQQQQQQQQMNGTLPVPVLVTNFTAMPKSTSELSKMLLSIQNREMRMMQNNLHRNDQALLYSDNKTTANSTAPINGANNAHLYTNYKSTPHGKLYAVSEQNTTVPPRKEPSTPKFKRPSLSLIRGRSDSKAKHATMLESQMNGGLDNNESAEQSLAERQRQQSFDSVQGDGSGKLEKSEKKSRFRSNSISSFVMNNSPSLSRKVRKNKQSEKDADMLAQLEAASQHTLQTGSFSPIRGNDSVSSDGIAASESDPSTPIDYNSHRTTPIRSMQSQQVQQSRQTQRMGQSQSLHTVLSGLGDETRHRAGSQHSQTSSNSNSNSVANYGTSRQNSFEEVLPIAVNKKKSIIYTDPVQRQGAAIAATALNKIQVYLKLPVDHLDFSTDEQYECNGGVSVKDIAIDWSLKVCKPTVSIFTSMVVGSTWQAIRAVTVMKADKMNLLALLTDDTRMGEYDDMFDFFQFIAKVDSTTCIRRVCFKAVWPTAPRDFLICTTHEILPDGSIIIATMSAPDELCPQQKGYVRGSIQISGYYIQPYNAQSALSVEGPNGVMTPLQPGECKLTLTAHSELGGTLPVSVINMLSTNAPMKILQSITEIMKKQGK